MQWLIVAGGGNEYGTPLSSAEIYDYSGGAAGWVDITTLVTFTKNFVGGSIGGIFYITGGTVNNDDITDKVFSWDGTEWIQEENLAEQRTNHALTVVKRTDIPIQCL